MSQQKELSQKILQFLEQEKLLWERRDLVDLIDMAIAEVRKESFSSRVYEVLEKFEKLHWLIYSNTRVAVSQIRNLQCLWLMATMQEIQK